VAGCVVCGVPDSPIGIKVAKVGATLSARLDARLLLVHVAEIAPQIMYGVPFDSERFQREGLERSRDLLREVADESGVTGAERTVEWGSPAAALLEVADREDAVLIVVGTRGRGELKAAALGSVSHRLAAEAPCAVVVVPPQASRLPT
jgi:nucleotide-binding universal stress UspA family protein